MLNGQRVLITGGLGFIGSTLAHRCLALGAQVTVLDSLAPRGGGDPRNLQGTSALVVRGDIRDASVVRPLVQAADAIVHCAAATSHTGSLDAPLESASVNLLGTLQLLEIARADRPSVRFVQVSTSSQLGPIESTPATEDHPERPTDLYSACKSGAEKTALVYHVAHGMSVTSIRLPNVYGPRARLDVPGPSVAAFFIGRGAAGLALTVFRPGEQLRNFLFVDDAVDALVRALIRPEVVGRVLQVAHDEHHSVLDFAHAVAAGIGGRVELVDWPAGHRRIELGDVVLDNTRAREALGWRPATSLGDGLARTAAWLRARERGEA